MASNPRCPVETKLGLEAALEMDAFLADPRQWPKAIYEAWDLPPGPLPGNVRQWGAVKLGMEWAKERGVDFKRLQMERHVREHVPILPFTPDDVAIRGVVPPDGKPPQLPDTVRTFRDVYEKGLQVGWQSLDLLQKRIDALVEGGGNPPVDLLLKMADLGTKLATSQASLMARGSRIDDDRDEEIEGFRAGTAPLPSQRLGHHRVRVVDGEARPVRDEGPADRHDYNASVRDQGGIELPAP